MNASAIDRNLELIVGYIFAVIGGVFIVLAMPDYGTGILMLVGIWFAIIGSKHLSRKENA